MIVGIDLGTTNSAIAYINDYGKPEIIPNREGGRTTPSVIQFEGKETVIIGEEAKDSSVFDPFNSIEFIKSEMGNPKYKFISGSATYSPEELSGLILRKLKEDAEETLNRKIDKAVVTVPAYFNDAQRKATQDSGKVIGLDIVKIINEPTAAAIAYGLLNNSSSQNILVYDLGGGTFDATIVSINDKEIAVQATDGIRELGGRDFDGKIIEYAISKFKEKHGIDLEDIDNVKELQEVRRNVEKLKKALSSRKESKLYVSCKGIRESITISRSQFEDMIRPLYRRTEIVVGDVLRQANMDSKHIDKILLVGGSTRIPLISEGLKNAFGIEPSREVNPDEVVAMGAAIQGDILNDSVKEVQNNKLKITDVSSHSIGVVTIDSKSGNKINSIILNRNSPLPAKSKRSFYTIEDNQEVIKLQITEGELEEIEYVTILGEFAIELPPKLKKDTEVKIEMILDENQIIHVFTRIPKISDFLKEVHITRESNLKPEELIKKKDIVSKIDTGGIVNLKTPEKAHIPKKEKTNIPPKEKTHIPEELKPLEKFVGLDDLKNEIMKIYNRIKFNEIREHRLGHEESSKEGNHFVITGNPGTGKTTVTKTLCQVFADIGLIKENKLIETDRKGLVGQYIGETEKKTQAKIEEALGGILFIDEAYALYKPDSPRDFGKEAIEVLLSEMENRRDEFIVIIAGYKDEMDIFFESNPGLKSRFNYFVRIPDFSNDELINIAEKIAYEKYYLISEDGKAALLERINIERADEHFGNARVVRKLVEEAIQNFASRILNYNVDELGKEELILLEEVDFSTSKNKSPEEEIESALLELNNLIGLAEVKEQVDNVINRIQVNQQKKEMGLKYNEPSLHMLFIGNPGTGKTTVAKIIGRIYKALGVLKKGDRFKECTRKDFVSNHVGETALKSQKLIKSALGGILFIDEAYSLYQGEKDSFGKEAIDELIKEMEDNRDNLMVIMAGYPKEMETLLSSNSGFQSRINTTITFEDYSVTELLDIFKIMCKSSDMIIDEKGLEKLGEYMEKLLNRKSEGFGNGREVRNIFEKVMESQNNRVAKLMLDKQILSKEEIMKIKVEDILCL